MSTAVPAPPVARTPRWLRPLLLAGWVALLLASVAVSTDQTLTRRWSPTHPHDLLRPTLSWGVTSGEYNDHYIHLPTVFGDRPAVAVALGTTLTHLYILGPIALLGSLFCARLGVEQSRATETGILPTLLAGTALMLAVGSLGGMAPSWPVFVSSRLPADTNTILLNGILPAAAPWNTFMLVVLLLSFFAAIRADPSAPVQGGYGWTVAAGGLGGLCLWIEMYTAASIAALGLYVWWSAGWRRAAGFGLGMIVINGLLFGWWFARWGSVDTPPCFSGAGWVLAPWLSAPLFLATALASYGLRLWMPIASARQMIGFLLFISLMSAPMSIFVLPRFAGSLYGWQFFVLPSVLAAGLAVTAWSERVRATPVPPS